MILELFIATSIWMQRFAVSNPIICWDKDISNITIKVTQSKDIECHQPEKMASEVFFQFDTLLHNCTEIPGLPTKIDHQLELSVIDNMANNQTVLCVNLTNLSFNFNRLVNSTAVQLPHLEKFTNLVKFEIYNENETRLLSRNWMKLDSKLEIFKIVKFCNSCSIKLYGETWSERIFAFDSQFMQSISLTNKSISAIGREVFDNLTNLETLNLNSNNLRNVEFLVDIRLPQLRVLNLGNNRIRTLQQSLGTLGALEELHLNNNGMRSISDGFFTEAQTKLSLINLQDNRLTFKWNSGYMNPFQPIASSLVTLNLKSNNLGEFNDQYVKFRLLETLDYSHNKLQGIRGTELYFKNKITVNFESNQIAEIRFLDDASYSNVSIKFGNNPSFELTNCANYEFIKYFRSNPGHIDFPALDNVSLPKYYCFEKNSNVLCEHGQCECKKFPYTKNYIIDCNNKTRTNLPTELPNFSESSFSIFLDLDNNNFANLTNFRLPTVYYTKISRVSLRNCSLNNFDEFQLHADNRITELYLDHNHIPNLSAAVIANLTELTNLTNITLFNNRFECNCDTEHLYNFFTLSHHYDPNSLTCANREMSTFMQNKSDIVCRYITTIITALVISLVVVILVAAIVIVKVKFALELKLLIFVFKARFCHGRQSGVTNFPYDLFLSYSDEDTDFVERNILAQLESDTKSSCTKIVTINRDGIPGKWNDEQIVDFVDKSKFIMIVLSKNFLESDWHRFTFRAAYCNAFQDHRYPVIIILKDKLKDLNSIDPTLKSYLKTRMYLRYNSRFFWKRINYILSK